MKIKRELKASGDLTTLDLPDGIGITPNSISGHRMMFECETHHESLMWFIECNLTARPKGYESVEANVSTERVLILTDSQFNEFNDALKGSNGTVIWSEKSFKPVSKWRSAEDEYVITDVAYEPKSWIKRLFNFPNELRGLITELRLLVAEANTVKNDVVVKFDREESSYRRERERDLRRDYSRLSTKYLDVVSKNERLTNRIAANRAQYDEEAKADEKLIRDLQFKISTGEEDILREAELIKSRIAAEQAKKVADSNIQ